MSACGECGTAWREGARFCGSCGSSQLAEVAAPPDAWAAPAAGTVAPTTPARPAPAVVIGVVVLAVVVLGVFVAGRGGGGSSDTSASATEQEATSDTEVTPYEPAPTTETSVAYSTTTTEAPSSPVDADLQEVVGRDFAIAYPQGWQIDKLDVTPAGTSYLDTTIKRQLDDPHYVVRVDVLPTGTAEQSANDAVNSLRGRPSFQLLAHQAIVFDTRSGPVDAVYLEFILDHPDDGVPMHTIDILFSDAAGKVFAVLTRAPVSEFSSWELIFERVRASFELR